MIPTVSSGKCKAFEQQHTPALHVTSEIFPVFIFSTSDDRVVSVRASVDFYEALNSAGVSAKLHIFVSGSTAAALDRKMQR
jgi:dipeptidyl aminopeptidase/acylaminoacyl peptidase